VMTDRTPGGVSPETTNRSWARCPGRTPPERTAARRLTVGLTVGI
jgi:hypothetical protein